MQYRREIDGLRAVAVLPVILFHAGFNIFSGGYVGVDVFFVISGYLITTILITELEQGNFSLMRFYERRARRILPALFVVMFACLPFAYLWMLPAQLKDFGESLMAVVVFASNILFWRESGYFGAAAELKPLLHTWSLAVEEQYYLIFPLFLLFAWRFGRQPVFWCVVVFAVLSLGLSEWGWRNQPTANFYLAPTRVWELLAGSICAFLSVGKEQRSSNLLGNFGLALIVFAVLYFDENTPFPSVFALVPVLGTALIILYATPATWAGRVLSTRGFVGIGLISYSAYLWHQPLFAFARLRSLNEPTHFLMGALVVAALLLAWGSWRWVEQPFRKRSDPLLAKQIHVFLAAVSIGAVFVLVGLVVLWSKGFEGRLNDDLKHLAIADNPWNDVNADCFIDRGDPISFDHPSCEFANSRRNVDVLLAGDSHLFAISNVLSAALRARDIGHYSTSASGCVPLVGFQPFGQVADRDCLAFGDAIYEDARARSVRTIVLTARFPWYLRGAQFDNGEGGIESGAPAWADLRTARFSSANDPDRRARVLAAYEAQIRAVAEQFNVVLVYPIPEAGWNVPDRALKQAFFADEVGTLTTAYAAYIDRTVEVNALFDRLVEEVPSIYGAKVFKPLCSDDTGRCLNADQNGSFYRDDDHLNERGAQLVVPLILDAVEASLER